MFLMDRAELKVFIYISSSCSSNSFSQTPLTTEEISDCTNEAAKGANKAPRNLLSCFFISYFTVFVTRSIKTPKSPNNFMIFIILVSSFKQIKQILSNLFIAFEVKVLTNPGKLSLAIGIATSVSAFFLN